MCILTSVMMMTFKDPVGCARDLQWQIARPLWGWECCGTRHPGSINGVSAHFAPKHFLMTVWMCLQGQARDSGRQWTPWSSQPEETAKDPEWVP